MVGKIKRVRQKLHLGAVRLDTELDKVSRSVPPCPPPQPGAQRQTTGPAGGPAVHSQDLKVFNFPKGIFTGTKISPEVLVQTLKVDQPSPVRTSSGPAGHQQTETVHSCREEKKQQTKKEKMKERRQRWLNKISAVKQAREQQVALERRRATPVVGDMRVLADALPDLTSLLPSTTTTRTSTRTRTITAVSAQKRHRGSQKKRAEPEDYYQMKPAQKRKLLETEMSRFSEMMKDSVFRADPLSVIQQHLRKRLRQEDEQS